MAPEQAIEAIWPEAGRAEGRNRLGTVLHRLLEALRRAVELAVQLDLYDDAGL